MDEAHPRLLAQFEQLGVPFSYLDHLVRRDLAVVQWNGPIRCALKDRQ